MFDKRLTKLCPESHKYIIGNIILQWLELALNTVMIITVAKTISSLYYKEWSMHDLTVPIIIICITLVIRFFTAQGATRMSYLASRTVKQKMRELIYAKLLKLGSKYREQVSTAELVQESVEGVDQLESYFGLYVPQFFYAFIAPVTLFFLFGLAGSWATATVLLVCVPLIPGAIMMIMTLPNGYDTQVGELGETLSGGERQRIGLARAFLHDAPFILLDEPTSNLDSLNEAVILKSLKEAASGKTVVLVSHRASTMRIADKSYSVENGRLC